MDAGDNRRHDVSRATGIVYVVDDDDDLRDELSDLLSVTGFDVRAFANCLDFIDAIESDYPACVLLDVRMPGMDGMAALTQLQDQVPLAVVIMLSGHGDIPIAVQATKAGAIDFIEKPVASAVLMSSIDEALRIANERVSEAEPVEGARRLVSKLSRREYQVLQGMVAGLANKVIAYRLDLSQRTVEIYRAKLMRKLGTRSLPLAVQKALAAGVPPLNRGGGTLVQTISQYSPEEC